MRQNIQALTNYLHKVQRLATLPAINFPKKECFQIGIEELRTGSLPRDTTSKLFKLAKRELGSERNEKENKENKPIKVILSLVTLSKHQKGKTGLLLMPAELYGDGRLVADIQNSEPWIPANRLKADKIADLDVMVGALTNFWSFRYHKGEALASQVGIINNATTPEEKEEARRLVWNNSLDYAFSLFKATAGCSHTEFANHHNSENHGSIIESEQCFVQQGDAFVATRWLLQLYEHLEGKSSGIDLYQRLLELNSLPPRSSESIDTPEDPHEDGLLASALQSCGNMGSDFPLSASQRRALHAFLRDGAGDITAVSGPPGTGKTTLLQAAVANLIVRHALDGKDPPLIVGTSAGNQAVTNIIDSFSSVVKEDHGALDWRWIPLASEDFRHRHPLKSIATYCPADRILGNTDDKYLIENISKTGVYTQYSDEQYIKAAGYHFRNAAKLFAPLSERIKEIDTQYDTSYQDVLTNLLREINKIRCRLLEAAFVRDQNKVTKERHERAQQALQQLRDKLSVVQKRLIYWERIQKEVRSATNIASPADGQAQDKQTLSFLERILLWLLPNIFKPSPKKEAVEPEIPQDTHQIEETHINIHRAELDDFPIHTKTFNGVFTHYNQKYHKLLSAIEEAENTLATIVAKIKKHTEAQRAITQHIERLGRLGALHRGEEDAKRLRLCKTLAALDEALDISVRYVEFWLAIHIYEARWLATAKEGALIESGERWKTSASIMTRYWPQACCITPCFVMTVYQVPKYFKIKTKTGLPDTFDLSRIDLLIVDEAGQVDTSLGAPVFALAKRALVVGDVHQLSPVWGIDQENDREYANACGLKDHWETMVLRGLTASNPSSLMRAACNSCLWIYRDGNGKQTPGLILTEHRRCHEKIIGFCNELIYNGILIPCRPLKGYALAGKTPSPFLFHIVEGSFDRQQSSSRCNDAEAETIARWVKLHFAYFCSIYPNTKHAEVVGIVTPFRAQAQLIENKLISVCGRDTAKHITVGTAHKLQGAERPIVLFSSVYGDNSPKAGFIDNTLELMNVSVSRAKDLFIIFGARTRWIKDDGTVFKLVRKHATLHDCFFVPDTDQQSLL